ncbi:MAG: (4Fe-4S)-binding protein [Syntrophobacterales bacterium CG23_combo_of_CG06-09_8_20_14_all_48_27]|nr:MAG: (4Fe-4S)-binding protein [Syntrophobacterales bacterium CG23_combo_of_CG06-09_8_20_14_all_48_27]
MRQLTIVSGKGGTGKTTITAAFAALAKNHVMADGDVDAADLHLILTPHIKREEEFYGGRAPSLDKDKCNECGICMEVCRFEAIHDFAIDPISCEGCGLCMHACPQEAIKMEEKFSGHWFISDTRFGPMVHARLGIAEENSGKLVTLVRQQARLIAEEENKDLIIIDGPPGIGCPVIASITGVNLVLAVTEPTLSGIHDLERVLGVAHHFNVPAMVCINKCDINPENARKIRDYCQDRNIEVVGEIPYDPVVTRAMVEGQTVVEYGSNVITDIVKRMWERIKAKLQDGLKE